MWESLKAVADLHPVLAEFELDTLIARAEAQLQGLTRERIAAAELALTGSEDVPESTRPAAG